MTQEGHCMKCKSKKEMTPGSVEPFIAKNGANMARGTCATCGTKMCAILPKTKAAEPKTA